MNEAEKGGHVVPLAAAMDNLASAMDRLNRTFAAIKIETAEAMTKTQAERVDQIMRENPDFGWLDAAAQVEAEGVV